MCQFGPWPFEIVSILSLPLSDEWKMLTWLTSKIKKKKKKKIMTHTSVLPCRIKIKE